jgi:hypothetical protein
MNMCADNAFAFLGLLGLSPADDVYDEVLAARGLNGRRQGQGYVRAPLSA